MYDWLIDYWLTSSEQDWSQIKHNIEMREGIGQPVQRLWVVLTQYGELGTDDVFSLL